MDKVSFTDNTGRRRQLRERDARLLQRLGRGTYQTRMLVAEPTLAGGLDAQTSALTYPDALDAMDAPALRALARQRGVKTHHRSGADKLRAALREAA